MSRRPIRGAPLFPKVLSIFFRDANLQRVTYILDINGNRDMTLKLVIQDILKLLGQSELKSGTNSKFHLMSADGEQIRTVVELYDHPGNTFVLCSTARNKIDDILIQCVKEATSARRPDLELGSRQDSKEAKTEVALSSNSRHPKLPTTTSSPKMKRKKKTKGVSKDLSSVNSSAETEDATSHPESQEKESVLDSQTQSQKFQESRSCALEEAVQNDALVNHFLENTSPDNLPNSHLSDGVTQDEKQRTEVEENVGQQTKLTKNFDDWSPFKTSKLRKGSAIPSWFIPN